MPQNRNKLIELFISNITTAIVHEILEQATKQEELLNRYRKEVFNSISISIKYRDQINPKYTSLPEKDIEYIKHKLTQKITQEIQHRITKGYENIDISLIPILVEKNLQKTKII